MRLRRALTASTHMPRLTRKTNPKALDAPEEADFEDEFAAYKKVNLVLHRGSGKLSNEAAARRKSSLSIRQRSTCEIKKLQIQRRNISRQVCQDPIAVRKLSPTHKRLPLVMFC